MGAIETGIFGSRHDCRLRLSLSFMRHSWCLAALVMPERGKVRDCEVDFAALPPFLYRVKELGYRAGLGLFHLIGRIIQIARKCPSHSVKGL